jgi:hypothetical protein
MPQIQGYQIIRHERKGKIKMTYKLKDHVTDEMLIACGFDYPRFKHYLKTKFIYPPNHRQNKAYFEVKINLNTKEIVENRIRELLGSGWGGNSNTNVTSIKVKQKHIQDLIELGYVEEMK